MATNQYGDAPLAFTLDDVSELEQCIRDYATILHQMGAARAPVASRRQSMHRDHRLDTMGAEMRRVKTRYDEFCQEHRRLVGVFDSTLFVRSVERSLLG